MHQRFGRKKRNTATTTPRVPCCAAFSIMLLVYYSHGRSQKPKRLLHQQEEYTVQEIMQEVRDMCGETHHIDDDNAEDTVCVSGLVLLFENEEIAIANQAQLELASRMLAAYMHNSVRMRYTVS
tara:strand:+ start:15390 stop:15761 length:372 start_codon:yes stop_codon:yes gene_type:complete